MIFSIIKYYWTYMIYGQDAATETLPREETTSSVRYNEYRPDKEYSNSFKDYPVDDE